MKKIFFLSSLFAIMFTVTASIALDVQKEQEKMIGALKNVAKGSQYFQMVTWDVFSQANAGMKGTLIMETCSYNYDCIPSLVGGFRNKDVKVRTAIYSEFMRLGFTKDGIKGNKNGNQYLNHFNAEVASSERTEKDTNARQAVSQLKTIFAMTVSEALEKRDHRSLAAMDPKTFANTNAGDKMTIINAGMQESGAKGIQVFNFCLEAATLKGGNIQTQKYIVSELMAAAYIFPIGERRSMVNRVKQKMAGVTDAGLKSVLNSLVQKLDKAKK